MQADHWWPNTVWVDDMSFINTDLLKEYAYNLKSNSPGINVSNINGWHSNFLDVDSHKELKNVFVELDEKINEICLFSGYPKLELDNSWFIINGTNSFNAIHNHFGSLLSGVFYIDAQEDQGNIIFERNDDAEYFLPAPTKQNTFLNSLSAEYPPRTGALYIFGSWMKHWVNINNTEKDRICLSFNYRIAQ